MVSVVSSSYFLASPFTPFRVEGVGSLEGFFFSALCSSSMVQGKFVSVNLLSRWMVCLP